MKQRIVITIFGIAFIVWAISTFFTISLMKFEDLGITLFHNLSSADESLFMMTGIIFALWLFVIGLGILRRDWVIYRLLLIFIWLWNLVNLISLVIIFATNDYPDLKYIIISFACAIITLLFFNRDNIRSEFKK